MINIDKLKSIADDLEFDEQIDTKNVLRILEQALIKKALVYTHGNITQASDQLNLNRGTVRRYYNAKLEHKS